MFKKIDNVFTYNFPVGSEGLYSISISAICKKKNHLRVEIDGMALKSIMPKSRNEFFNIPPAWNGNELKNTAKTVVFIVKLRKGDHSLKFIPKGEADIVSEPVVTLLNNKGPLALFKDIQSEERNCQPWITVALIDIPLSILDISVSCSKKFLDSDDVKLVIDGKTQKNKQSILRGKNWFWRGRQLRGKTQTDRFYLNLPSGVHYIELWADRTPKLHSLELGVNGGGIDKGEYANRNLEWWEKWKPVKVYTYKGVLGDEDYNRYDDLIVKATAYWNKEFFSDLFPPDEPLEPNLVKAVIFQESRVGNDSNGKLNIMQVGNPGDLSLKVLNNATEKPEYELKNGKLWLVDYNGEAKVDTIYDSVHWGVRWLYHRAQWIGSDGARHWYPWRESIKRYGPGTEDYTNNVWSIYIDGVDARKSRSSIKLWILSFFLFAFILPFSFLQYNKFLIKMAVFNEFTLDQRSSINDIDIKIKLPGGNLFLAIIEREKDWWEVLKIGRYIGGRIEWLRLSEAITEQSILAAGFSHLKVFSKPVVWVYGETHAGHGNFYLYIIEDDDLKLAIKTPAVDYNPDIRWSPDNFENYGYGQCGEILRGGKLLDSFKDINGDGVFEIILKGTEDVICEKKMIDSFPSGAIQEVKVASNEIYKIFYLPHSIALNVGGF